MTNFKVIKTCCFFFFGIVIISYIQQHHIDHVRVLSFHKYFSKIFDTDDIIQIQNK